MDADFVVFLAFIYLEFSTSFRFSSSSTTNSSKLSNVLFVFLQKIRLKSSIEVLSKGHQLPFSHCLPEPSYPFSVDFDSISVFKVQKWPLSLTICVNMLNTKFLPACRHVTSISCSLWTFAPSTVSYFVLLSVMSFLPCLFLVKAYNLLHFSRPPHISCLSTCVMIFKQLV